MNPDTDRTRVNDPEPCSRPTRPWCFFECGRSAFAVTLDAVAEVVEVDRLVRLPASPPRVLGVCTLRREVIPVVDLRDPADEWPGADAPARLLLVILKTARGHWAIRVEAEGTAVATEALDELPQLGTRPSGLDFVGSIQRGDRSYAVIDAESTWMSVRRVVEGWHRDHRGRDRRPNCAPGFSAQTRDLP